MKTVTLANNRVFEDAHVLESNGNLFVYVNDENETLATVFNALNVKANVRTIVAFAFERETIYEGYTDLVSIRKDGTTISACLRRE